MGRVHVKLSDSPALYAPSGLLALAQNRARQPSPSGVEVASISQVSHCSAIVPPAYNRCSQPGHALDSRTGVPRGPSLRRRRRQCHHLPLVLIVLPEQPSEGCFQLVGVLTGLACRLGALGGVRAPLALSAGFCAPAELLGEFALLAVAVLRVVHERLVFPAAPVVCTCQPDDPVETEAKDEEEEGNDDPWAKDVPDQEPVPCLLRLIVGVR